MTYTIENISNCQKKIVFSYDEVDFVDEIKTELLKQQKDAVIKGFRKGKAPLSMIEKIYRPQIEGDLLNKFISDEFRKTVEKEKLNMVGRPDIGKVEYDSLKKINFEALVEVFPEFSLNKLENVNFSKDDVYVTDEEVDQVKNHMIDSKANLVGITDNSIAIENDLQAVMNFKGTRADGSAPPEMEGKEFVLEVGSKRFIPGFEEQLIGMKISEKKTIKVTFPEDYHQKDLCGEEVSFEVEILEIKKLERPDFTDEFVKDFSFSSVEDFLEKTKKNLMERKEKESTTKLHQEVLEKLVEKNKFDVPSSLIGMQENALKEDLASHLKGQGFNEDMLKSYYEKWGEGLQEKALFQVRSALILEKLADENKIEATEDDFVQKMEEAGKSQLEDVDKLKKYYEENADVKAKLMYGIREEKTIQKVIEFAAS
ncbi:trigger factor [Bacteriovoracaceae bacterium]|nr:trigger factor [Bacteriovoracaceae bacterium]